jgi:hypothetical protein
MKPRISGLIGIVALVGGTLVSCKSDPTADGVGTPVAVELDFSHLDLSVGDSAKVVATIVDNRLTPLEGDVTFSSCDPTSATVTPDNSYNPVPPLSKRATIHAIGPNATCIIASSGSAKPDSTTLTILTTQFAGAFSVTSADPGTILTISSTQTLKFDPATAKVTFAGGEQPPIVSATADQIQVVTPFTADGPLTIDGIVVTYVPGLVVSLPTSTSFTQTGTDTYTPADQAWNSAPDISSFIPAAGQSSWLVTTGPTTNPANTCPEDRWGFAAFGLAGNCILLKFTLAAPATLSFTTDWNGGSGDVDVVVCSDSTLANFDQTLTTFTPCADDGLAGATSNKPEVAGGVTYPAGTYWLALQDFDGGGVTNVYVKIEQQ